MAIARTPRPGSALRAFLDSEAAGGMALIAAAAAALALANSPLGPLYHDLVHAETGPALTPGIGPMSVHLWINDALMALFFLLVGLEIKRELVDGRLATWNQRRLPAIAAAVGMIVPALIYLALTAGAAGLSRGWAIPAATDIAFAIGVLALLGSRAPTSLKLFLTTVAIVDDMGAVAIIALAYTESLNALALGAGAAILFAMYMLGRSGVRALPPYLIAAAALWYAVLLSGVHATVAGVLAAMMIPIVRTGRPDAAESPLHRIEHAIAPWVAFLIVPLFGFANAGVSLDGISAGDVLAPLPLGIAAGLFVGKQIGIFGAVWLAVRCGIASKLRGATWLQVYGVATLCGIGFTMSLFIAALAFPHEPALVEEAKIGILLGSFASAVTGFLILRLAPAHPERTAEEQRQRAEIERDGDVVGYEETK
ncbi:MAG: Na+:H+ antiporter, NhaA family [Sphingomonadales bacterium]|jgi:NhaA family Na+:H+ antiporter|nr:Na+:H+ antiporter, NhaA family [Sphingomonadales bacterium]